MSMPYKLEVGDVEKPETFNKFDQAFRDFDLAAYLVDNFMWRYNFQKFRGFQDLNEYVFSSIKTRSISFVRMMSIEQAYEPINDAFTWYSFLYYKNTGKETSCLCNFTRLTTKWAPYPRSATGFSLTHEVYSGERNDLAEAKKVIKACILKANAVQKWMALNVKDKGFTKIEEFIKYGRHYLQHDDEVENEENLINFSKSCIGIDTLKRSKLVVQEKYNQRSYIGILCKEFLETIDLWIKDLDSQYSKYGYNFSGTYILPVIEL